MKMTRIELNKGTTLGILEQLDGAHELPLFVQPYLHAGAEGRTSDLDDTGVVVASVPDDVAPVSDAAQVAEAKVEGLSQALAAAASAARAARAAAIEGCLADATTREHIAWLEAMKALNIAGGQLPRGGNKYHVRATLALGGVTWEVFLKQPALRKDVNRIAPMFKLGETQASAHVRGDRVNSMQALARAGMDEMERLHIPIARQAQAEKARYPSGDAFADHMGWPRSVVRRSGPIRMELNLRVSDGRLTLGEPFFDPGAPTRAQKRVAYVALKKVLKERLRTGRPIPARSERSDKIDLDALLDEAELFDPRLREDMKNHQMFRRDLSQVIRKVRLKPVHLSRIDPRVVEYGRLEKEGEPLLRQIYRADTPRAEAGSAAEDGWVANQLSFLNRFRKVNGRTPADDAAPDLQGEDHEELRDAGHTASVKGNIAYGQSLDRWKRIVDTLVRSISFPASFAGALDAAMVASGLDAPTLARRIGCKKALIHAWRQGVSLPTFQNLHLAAALERELGLTSGTLGERLPTIRSSRTIYGGRKEVTLADGTVVQLAGLWRYMHTDAPMWSEEKLREQVEEARERVFGADTPHRVRMRAAISNAYELPEPDTSSPIWAELDDLVAFQTGLIDDGRLRHPRSEWRSAGTVKLHRGQITTFVRWLMLAEDKGGAGFAPGRISFSLIMNYRLVLRYVVWRVMRSAHLKVNGEAIGPRITATEKQLLALFAGLLDPVFGWLAQSRHVVAPVVADPREFREPFIRAGKDGIDIVDDETCRRSAWMPAAVVAAANADWAAASGVACAHIRSATSRFQQSFKLIRDPQQLMMPILRHQHPVAVGLRMAREALDHARPIETSPHLHAADVQKALAFLMLLLVVFRSQTMRALTWRPDGTGNIRKVNGGYEVVVEAGCFKNGVNPELFGPSWNPRDYERALGDWAGLNRVLDHYLAKCRPILLAGRESDLLFPPPKGRTDWSEHNFNHLVMSFTRKWCVYNPRTGTGMRGVKAFGPHPARNIVATHIIRNHPTEDRWRLASIVLATGVEQVKTRYGWVTSREELAKTDYLFKEASDIAGSEADLY